MADFPAIRRVIHTGVADRDCKKIALNLQKIYIREVEKLQSVEEYFFFCTPIAGLPPLDGSLFKQFDRRFAAATKKPLTCSKPEHYS